MLEVAPEPQLIKILLVDDRPENLLALRAALRDDPYELVEAESGYAALDRLDESEFAAVLLDVQMPGMDGFETARQIRARERFRATPIIFVTAIDREEAYEERGYHAGAVDYLFKPVNISILRAKVAVFAELWRAGLEIRRQAELLRERQVRERENEILRQALSARDEFLAVASHELKTPITPLRLQMESFLRLLEQDGGLALVDPSRLRRMLVTSVNQVERLSRVVDELLDVSRFSTGRIELRRELVDLGSLVRQAVGLFTDLARQAGCELVMDIDEGIFGNWDAFRLEQVITNFLTNALKYGAGHPVTVRAWRTREGAAFSVRDHGIGIAPEDCERIFHRFERVHSSRHFGGLGLGLYIAQNIMSLHRGSIEVSSRLGEGAVFTACLPSTESALPAATS